MVQATYGYVRVSTKDQHTDRQLIALQNCNIPLHDIYIDKLSGKDFKRPAYKRMVRKAKKGDLIIIKSIDRLGRNYEEIIEQWRFLTKEKGVDIKILDMPLLDTSRSKDLLGTFISDIVLQLLSFVAQNERENIRIRQAEGIRAAQIRGVKFGRPKITLPEEFSALQKRWEMGEISSRQAAEELDISYTTFLRRVKEMECVPLPLTVIK